MKWPDPTRLQDSLARCIAGLFAMAAVTALLGGCVPWGDPTRRHDQIPHPSYKEAETRLIGYVDDTFAEALPDRPKPEPPLVSEDPSCNDAHGMPVDELSLIYKYEVPTGEEGSTGILRRAESYWLANGFTVERDTGTPEVPVSFATLDNTGYHLSVAVNEPQRRISIGGSSPCVKSRLREELERLDEEARREG